MPHNDRRLKLLRAQKDGEGSWYSFKAKDAGPVEVMIYDEIGGWGISAEAFIKDLSSYKGLELIVRLNTPGGSVFDGNAIYNALKNHNAKVNVQVDGLAASMGAIIALSGDTLLMAKNAYMMVHHPWVMSIGTAEDMRKTADLLDKMAISASEILAAKSKKSAKETMKWMDETTWFTADEAHECGLCDEVGEAMRIAACFDLNAYAYARIPEALEKKNGEPPTDPPPPPDAPDAGNPPTPGSDPLPAEQTEEEKSAMAERWRRIGKRSLGTTN